MNGLSRLWKFLRQPILAGPRRAFRGLWLLSLLVLLLAPGAAALAQCEPPDPVPDCWNWDYDLCELYPDYPEQYCEAGYVWNFCTGECDPDCSEPIGDRPLPCYEWSSLACAWVDGPPPPEGCPSGSHWANCECLPDEGCEQPPQEDPCSWWDPDECIYVHFPPPECPPGEIPGPNCDCLPCDPGPEPPGCYELSEDGCSWVPSEPTEPVPPGYVWNPDTCTIDRDCSILDPNEPDPGHCYEYNAAACGYVERELPWTDWTWKEDSEPKMTAELAAGTPSEVYYWFTEGGSAISAAVTVIPFPGEAERMDMEGCDRYDEETITPEPNVAWEITGVSADPASGMGDTADATANELGTASFAFTVTSAVSTPEWTFAKNLTANSTGIVPVTETVFEHPVNQRARKTIGVCERVTCSLSRTPPSGTISWSVAGNGTINNSAGAATTFEAGDTAGGATVTVNHPAVSGTANTVTFTVIPPSTIVQEFHQFDPATTSNIPPLGIGLWAKTFLGPDTVNFGRTKFLEQHAAAQAWDYFWRDHGKPHNRILAGVFAGSHVHAGKGTILSEPDKLEAVNLSADPVVGWWDGGILWDIPCAYSAKYGPEVWHPIKIVRQMFTVEIDWVNGQADKVTLRVTKPVGNAANQSVNKHVSYDIP